MCPACYINGLLLLVFGTSGLALTNHPIIIIIAVVLTIGGFWWMWIAYKKNRGKGGLVKNLKTTLIYILIFAAGYLTAAYQTHSFWAPVAHDESEMILH
jgi:hypothetical protein